MMTREEAIEQLNNVRDLISEKAIDMAIEALEQTRWIPASERLPENSDTVLITHRGGVSFGWHNGLYWERGASTKHRELRTVIAWQPLPEPYREEAHQ